MKDCKIKKTKSKIGGQAVMEGVMMQSPTSMAIAVRDEQGQIQLTSQRLAKRGRASRIPFVRGVVNFIFSMIVGVRSLLKSAEVAIDDEVDVTNGKGMGLMYTLSMLLGFGLAIFLFVFLPTQISQWIGIESRMWKLVLEGLLKTAIMIGYFFAVSLLPDINRTFMYHGAEHKTIATAEAGLELTVENARGQSKHHDRCGTSFLVFIIIMSIIISMVFGIIATAVGFDAFFDETWVRTLIKLALLPFTAAICYELLMLLARSDFILLKPLKWLGKQMQRITTKEPDDKMLEVAIASFLEVQRLDADQEAQTKSFPPPISLAEFRKQVEPLLQYKTIESSDVDWILCAVLKVKRAKLRDDLQIPYGLQAKIEKMISRCAKGEPLQYVLGNTEFYGLPFITTPDCLIPRPETELVCEQALKRLEGKDKVKVLDLCCGSGCIGITIASKCKKALVTCSDISKKALAVAKKNAIANNVAVNFVQGDMFAPFNAPFNLIVCNPPYVKTQDIATLKTKVKDFEPIQALDGGKDGLDYYRQLAEKAPEYLYKDGVLIMEIGFDQKKEVVALFKDKFDLEVKKDYSGNDRIVIAVIKQEGKH